MIAFTSKTASRFSLHDAPLKIAVIGSGISGMSAAWLLSERHNVTVYERDTRIGGHSNTVDAVLPEGVTPVDTGFIVFNETNHPNLTALFTNIWGSRDQGIGHDLRRLAG